MTIGSSNGERLIHCAVVSLPTISRVSWSLMLFGSTMRMPSFRWMSSMSSRLPVRNVQPCSDVELPHIALQACRRVVLGIDRDRIEVNTSLPTRSPSSACT